MSLRTIFYSLSETQPSVGLDRLLPCYRSKKFILTHVYEVFIGQKVSLHVGSLTHSFVISKNEFTDNIFLSKNIAVITQLRKTPTLL